MTSVGDIRTELNTLAAATFPASFNQLRKVFNVETNDLRNLREGYGIRVLDGAQNNDVTKSLTIDSTWELILTNTNTDDRDDAVTQNVIDDLHDKADDFFAAVVNTKVNLPSLVVFVGDESFSEPELLEENKYVILRFQFTIRYRRQL